MKEFYSEVSEKKKIASGAKHKKNGSKSTTCHLQSDHLSPKQLKSLHGSVQTYQLGKPMDWATYLDMPKDLQQMYIKRLIEKYNVTNTRLAAMFGISGPRLSQKLTRLGIYRRRDAGRLMTPEQVAAWELFTAQKEQ